jgi:hypothetical protein
MTTTPLVTSTRQVASTMALAHTAYAGNIIVLASLADTGPTTILACMNRLAALGQPTPGLAPIADSVDNSRECLGNLIALALIAKDAAAVSAAATALEGLEP